MTRFSLRPLCQPLVELATRLAVRFHSTLSFDSPLSISCTLCNYFTAIGYYPFNLLIYVLYASRPDGWTHCADLMRYQLALLALFALYVAWRIAFSSSKRRVRDGSLLVLVALQLWVDWHGWYASTQAVANFQAWHEADDEEWSSGAHTAVDHSAHSHKHSPVQPPLPSSSSLVDWPSSPYQLSVQCGVGFSIHLVRLSLVNVAFTAAVALAFVLRIASERVSDEQKDRAWALWDAAVERVERQWQRLRQRARRVRLRHQRRRQRGGASSGVLHEADSDSDSDEWDGADGALEDGTQLLLTGRHGTSATER